jgi:hypothetical protein
MRDLPTFFCAVIAGAGACLAWLFGSLWFLGGAPPLPILPIIVFLFVACAGVCVVMTYELVRRLLEHLRSS